MPTADEAAAPRGTKRGAAARSRGGAAIGAHHPRCLRPVAVAVAGGLSAAPVLVVAGSGSTAFGMVMDGAALFFVFLPCLPRGARATWPLHD